MKKLAYYILFCIVSTLGNTLYASDDSAKVDAGLNFLVQDIDGNEQPFASYLGKGPVLVTFWALWCEGCKQEIKALQALSQKYKLQGVSMVTINTDKVKSIAKVRSFVKTQRVEAPVLLDPDGSISQERFAMESLPYSLILYSNGTVYKKYTGNCVGSEAMIRKDIEAILQ